MAGDRRPGDVPRSTVVDIEQPGVREDEPLGCSTVTFRVSYGGQAASRATIANDFERQSSQNCLASTMMKLIALVTAGLFAAGTMFAGEHGDCAKQVGNEAKAACQVTLASLNLTSDQKTKMDAAMEEHHKAGCTEASETKYMEAAKSILTEEQYAKFKAECKKGEKAKAQT
jgi:Spy/CpxP family protein refolding chaperone